MVEKGEAIKKYKLILNSYRDIKYIIGNIVNNILIIMYIVRWVYYQDDHLVSNVISHHCGVHLKLI